MGFYTMETGFDEKNSKKAEILYRILCMNKEASIKYLDKAGKICKMEDPDKRKKAYNAIFADLVHAIESSKKL